jgi:hypothetical protein
MDVKSATPTNFQEEAISNHDLSKVPLSKETGTGPTTKPAVPQEVGSKSKIEGKS